MTRRCQSSAAAPASPASPPASVPVEASAAPASPVAASALASPDPGPAAASNAGPCAPPPAPAPQATAHATATATTPTDRPERPMRTPRESLPPEVRTGNPFRSRAPFPPGAASVWNTARAPSMLGKTERRIALVILVTAILPLASAVVLASSMLTYASSVWLRPEVDQQLERGIDLYKDYIGVVKDDMKHQTDAMAGDEALRDAARRHDSAGCARALDTLFPRYAPPCVARRRERRRRRHRGARPRQAASTTPPSASSRCAGAWARPAAAPRSSRRSRSTGATSRSSRSAGEVRDGYVQLEKEREKLYAPYYEAFAALLGITVVATFALGFFLARGITRRINRLADAINEVAAGNLDVRVPVTGVRRADRARARLQPHARRDAAVARAHRVPAAHRRVAGDGAAPGARDQEPAHAHPARGAGVPPQVRAATTRASARCSTRRSRSSRRRSARCGASSGTSRASRACPHAELREASLRELPARVLRAARAPRRRALRGGRGGRHRRPRRRRALGGAGRVDPRGHRPADAAARAREPRAQRRGGHPRRPAGEGRRAARARGRARRGDPTTAWTSSSRTTAPACPRRRASASSTRTSRRRRTGTGLGLAIVKKIVVEHNGSIAARPERTPRRGGVRRVAAAAALARHRRRARRRRPARGRAAVVAAAAATGSVNRAACYPSIETMDGEGRDHELDARRAGPRAAAPRRVRRPAAHLHAAPGLRRGQGGAGLHARRSSPTAARSGRGWPTRRRSA